MTQVHTSVKEVRERFDQWVVRANRLLRQISAWSKVQGWPVKRCRKKVEDRLFGRYEVPCLVVTLPGGELHVTGIAQHMLGGDGLVELQGYPTLNRVRLLERENGWEIMTDSGVPLRLPWQADTFAQLAKDLLA